MGAAPPHWAGTGQARYIRRRSASLALCCRCPLVRPSARSHRSHTCRDAAARRYPGSAPAPGEPGRGAAGQGRRVGDPEHPAPRAPPSGTLGTNPAHSWGPRAPSAGAAEPGQPGARSSGVLYAWGGRGRSPSFSLCRGRGGGRVVENFGHLPARTGLRGGGCLHAQSLRGWRMGKGRGRS